MDDDLKGKKTGAYILTGTYDYKDRGKPIVSSNKADWWFDTDAVRRDSILTAEQMLEAMRYAEKNHIVNVVAYHVTVGPAITEEELEQIRLQVKRDRLIKEKNLTPEQVAILMFQPPNKGGGGV